MNLTPRRYRMIRRVALALAALPILQLSACQTGFNQISVSVINSLPSIFFNVFLNTLLSPIFALLAGTSDLSGLGGQGGIGGGI